MTLQTVVVLLTILIFLSGIAHALWTFFSL